jgi:hypothetical protein
MTPRLPPQQLQTIAPLKNSAAAAAFARQGSRILGRSLPADEARVLVCVLAVAPKPGCLLRQIDLSFAAPSIPIRLQWRSRLPETPVVVPPDGACVRSVERMCAPATDEAVGLGGGLERQRLDTPLRGGNTAPDKTSPAAAHASKVRGSKSRV